MISWWLGCPTPLVLLYLNLHLPLLGPPNHQGETGGPSHLPTILGVRDWLAADILWWATFIRTWNGTFLIPPRKEGAHHLWTDTSGSFGCGAVYAAYQEWLQLLRSRHCIKRWSRLNESGIALKELLPIVLACTIWGKVWQCSHVITHCDNSAVVTTVNTGLHKSCTSCVAYSSFGCTSNSPCKPCMCQALPIAGPMTFPIISTDNVRPPEDNPSASVRAADHPKTRLDIANLDNAFLELFLTGLADSTKQSYQSGTHHYLQVCSQFSLTPFPVSETLLT